VLMQEVMGRGQEDVLEMVCVHMTCVVPSAPVCSGVKISCAVPSTPELLSAPQAYVKAIEVLVDVVLYSPPFSQTQRLFGPENAAKIGEVCGSVATATPAAAGAAVAAPIGEHTP
jgi:hypothetical protein